MLRDVSRIVLVSKSVEPQVDEVQERARIYVKDPKLAPVGVQLTRGPRGGMWYDSGSVTRQPKVKPPKPTKAPKGKAPKKAKDPKPEKRELGQPFKGPDDPELPLNVRREGDAIRAEWVRIFNETLDGGGSEADALAAAKRAIPDAKDRGKDPGAETERPKRAVNQPFSGPDDPNVPRRIQAEAPDVKANWVKTFNDTLAKTGSENEAIHQANMLLPRRTTPKKEPAPVKAAKPPAPQARKELDMPDATRAMICLYVDPAIAEQLAILPDVDFAAAGGETEAAEDLHITLAYYPSVLVQERDALIQKAAQIASNWGVVMTKAEGIAQFFTQDPDEPIPYVVLVEPTDALRSMHYSLCDMYSGSPRPAMNHGFIPHITLAYVPRSLDVSINPVPIPPLVFDRLSVVFDTEQRHDFRLSGWGGDVVAYREMSEKIDNAEGDPDPAVSPTVEVSRLGVEDMNTTELAEAANDAAAGIQDLSDSIAESSKSGRRMRGSMRALLEKLIEAATGIKKYADYEDGEADGEDEENDDSEKELTPPPFGETSFVVFKDDSGHDRWISFSSNGFKDREREIIATDALERAVAKADETGNHGTLRLWHTPEAEIGVCDFQAIQGRFLLESGTFYDTELADAAREYFKSTDEKLGTSIGFRYPLDAFDGEVYREISEFVERSVLPHSVAANPWTAFITLRGVEPMDTAKAAWLEKVAGKDRAASIIAQADAATKALEGTVAFKENADLTSALEQVKSVVDAGTPEQQAAYAELLKTIVNTPDPEPEAKKEAEPEATAPAPVAFDETAFFAKLSEQLKPIADNAAEAAESAKAATAAVAAMDERVKSLESAPAEKSNAPRAASMFRATQASNNEASGEESKGMEPPEIPATFKAAMPYVEDLIKSGGVN